MHRKKKELQVVDVLSETLFNVSVYFMLYRILTVFIITTFSGYSWSINRDFGVLPILAFHMNIDEFATMNSNSQIATSLLIFIGFLVSLFKRPTQHFKEKRRKWKKAFVSAWYLGVIMSLVMYAVSVYINPALRFQTEQYTGIIIILLNIISLIMYTVHILYLNQKYKQKTTKKSGNEKTV